MKTYLFRHLPGTTRARTVNSSNLPNSIKKDRTHVLKPLYSEKERTGPTISNPGPMLLNMDATVLVAVTMETPWSEMTSVPAKNARTYKNTKAEIPNKVSSCTAFLPP